MLDIRTPLSKCTRVSRKVDVTSFIALPGIWLKINNDGSAANVATANLPAVAKLCISTYTGNIYESHDVEVGRITTLETVGARCGVDSDGYDNSIRSGCEGYYLSVSATSTYEGKLKFAGTGETVVAVAEGFDSVTGILTFTISDPLIMAATTTTPAPTTTTAAP